MLEVDDEGYGRWKIDLTINRWRSSPDPTMEAKLYFKISVSQLANLDGTFDKLPPGTMLQTYIQMGNEKEEDDYDFYNYVSTMRIDDVEKSDSLLRETSTPWYFDNNSCGSDLLGKIDGLTFQGVEAEATGCGFYMQDRENIGWTNSESNGVTWDLAIAR